MHQGEGDESARRLCRQSPEKGRRQSDLKKYVDGDMNLNDVGAKAKGASNDAKAEVKTCAQSALQKYKSSATKSS